MNNMSAGEQKLMAKYWGIDVLDNDSFWIDALRCLKDENILLPLENNPETVRYVQGLLDCQPGVCAECCRYGITPIVQADVNRIVKSGLRSLGELQNIIRTRDDGTMYMRGEPAGADCPFLENNTCSIYECRPDACFFFPIQHHGHESLNENGKQIQQMKYRIKCQASIDVIRKIMKQVLREGDKMLLPNLSVIKREV